MTTPVQWDNLIGRTAVGSDGGKLGKVSQVYLDEVTGQPAWVTVTTGMFGTRQSFAPLGNADVRDAHLVLAVPQHLVKDAPNIEDDGHLNDSETLALYQHYAGYLDRGPGRAGAQGHDTSGPNTDEAMTRSEERL